jgi:hypothetical protein
MIMRIKALLGWVRQGARLAKRFFSLEGQWLPAPPPSLRVSLTGRAFGARLRHLGLRAWSDILPDTPDLRTGATVSPSLSTVSLDQS